jgi:hypothetical protein
VDANTLIEQIIIIKVKDYQCPLKVDANNLLLVSTLKVDANNRLLASTLVDTNTLIKKIQK